MAEPPPSRGEPGAAGADCNGFVSWEGLQELGLRAITGVGFSGKPQSPINFSLGSGTPRPGGVQSCSCYQSSICLLA